MRLSLPVTALLSLLLAACAAQPASSPSKHISQSGQLKVHPGLLGQPVPPELQEPAAIKAASTATVSNNLLAANDKSPTAKPTVQRVHFDADSTELHSSDNEVIRSHARYLSGNPQARVRLEGHADERGSADYNLRLGQKRADAVRAALISQGVGEKQATSRSLGETQPKVKGHDETSWAENRRVEFVYEAGQPD